MANQLPLAAKRIVNRRGGATTTAAFNADCPQKQPSLHRVLPLQNALPRQDITSSTHLAKATGGCNQLGKILWFMNT